MTRQGLIRRNVLDDAIDLAINMGGPHCLLCFNNRITPDGFKVKCSVFPQRQSNIETFDPSTEAWDVDRKMRQMALVAESCPYWEGEDD